MQPILVSQRLRLRPYASSDASEVQRLAGERRVAEPTGAIPHPYPDGAAQAWISGHEELFASGRGVCYAIALATTSELLGTVSLLDVSAAHLRAEVGYWVGLEHWGHGYCTEALSTLMAFAENHFKTSRFIGRCLAGNLASARVLERCGFLPEGRQVGHVRRHGGYDDMLLFGKCCGERSAARP
jgi:ribosomal-protein-alanine N-acetyltransferase